MKRYDRLMTPELRSSAPSLSDFLDRSIRHRDGRLSAMPLERIYRHGAMVIRRGDGWAAAIELVRDGDSWSGKQIVVRGLRSETAVMGWPEQTPEQLFAGAIERVQRREEARGEMRRRMGESRQFINQRLNSWKDKKATRENPEYAALAVAYCEELRRGNAKATATLAEQLNISPAMMAQRIKEARRRLLLTAGEQGRASGEMTRLGMLYTDPDFPGLRQLRLDGKPIDAIAKEYRLAEGIISAALIAEGAGDLAGLNDESGD